MKLITYKNIIPGYMRLELVDNGIVVYNGSNQDEHTFDNTEMLGIYFRVEQDDSTTIIIDIERNTTK